MAKHLAGIMIEPAKNSGFTVTHHFHGAPSHGGMVSTFVKPEAHVFSAGQGHDMLAHIANNLSIPADEPAPALTPDAAASIRDKANA